jgi:hypothetical protein
LQLQWHKCANGEWCRLEALDVAQIDGYGAFVVWRPGNGRASVVLYVGSGALRQEIASCRRGPILGHTPGLRITWARVDPQDLDAVAAYLYQQLRPLWGEVPRPVPVLAVNLPLTA